MQNDPMARFKQLLAEAERLGIQPFNAAAFATTGRDLRPTVRMLLLKDVDERGFVFYTNLQSRKGRQLNENPLASACFWWEPLKRQVRVEGSVEIVSDPEADEYFACRPRGSQISTWASQQSSTLSTRDELLRAVALVTANFFHKPIPRPPYWSGYRLIPDRIEFWHEQPDRLHERELYTRDENGWLMTILAP